MPTCNQRQSAVEDHCEGQGWTINATVTRLDKSSTVAVSASLVITPSCAAAAAPVGGPARTKAGLPAGAADSAQRTAVAALTHRALSASAHPATAEAPRGKGTQRQVAAGTPPARFHAAMNGPVRVTAPPAAQPLDAESTIKTQK